MSAECNDANIPPGYKQTEVGVIPENWDVKVLESLIISLEAGVSVNSVEKEKDIYAHDVSILKTSCVIRGKFIPEERKTIVPKELHRAKVNPRKDSILISRMNTRELVGECGYIDKDYSNLFLPDRLWMTRHDSRIPHCVRWLAHLLSSNSFNRSIKDSATGTSGSMKNISKESLLAVSVPFPPKAEQEAIAEALSDADALIESLEQLIAKKRLIKQGAMEELLTGRIRIQGFGEGSGYKITEIGVIPEDWKSVCFAYYLNIMSGLGFKKAEYSDIGIRLLRIDNVSYGQISWDSIVYLPLQYAEKFPNLVLSEGDILLALNRPITNNQLKLAVLTAEDSPAILYQRVGKIEVTNDKLDKRFAYFILRKFVRKFVEESSVGSDQPFVSTTALKKIHIPLPPTKEEQIFIATMLSDMDSEITTLEEKLSKARQIKQGMMQELLTGRIRLV